MVRLKSTAASIGLKDPSKNPKIDLDQLAALEKALSYLKEKGFEVKTEYQAYVPLRRNLSEVKRPHVD